MIALADQLAIEAPPLQEAARLSMAALVGLAVGVEREWSGHASGPHARFAGLRTFLLLGLIGGAAGLLLAAGFHAAAAVLLAGGASFAVVAYAMAVRRPEAGLDGTTEGAALAVLALGALAGLGQIGLAAGTVAVVVLALGEKERLHWLVRKIGEGEMRATLQFAVLALVVLPLLPPGPYGPLGGIRPRTLWAIVLLFSALNFAGHVARHAVGARRGYGITGMIGGLVSSTAVTLEFSRMSRDGEDLARPLALGVIGACTVLVGRVFAASAVLNVAVAQQLLLYLVPAGVVGVALIVFALRRPWPPVTAAAEPGAQSPLRLWSAIQLAVGFQLAMMLLVLARQLWGAAGVLSSAALLGLTDVDALTVSMCRSALNGMGPSLAAEGIAVGILANTAVKFGIAMVVGSPRFRRAVAPGFLMLAGAVVLGIWLGATW
ncbi:MAG: DUF4010 domain-containing protein [Gemmatimonadota bacterium]|nr:DUF4010 domain-containing protein [Gemmatimonadota bacterium]MDE3127138.1 DUF4010 domain-containing protein [Gemmatimonadota bacterium]MDE3174357.1 DUF4010 domain-containing protein [Gemmatimonadota bacterium]MDE3216451.1 DUF4010 domain-containing protein [Gemmatimonadota bacterium]